MNDNPRKTPRAKWINYDVGLFFITICTMNYIHFFGNIHDGEMRLSAIGKIAEHELSHPEIHHPEINIPLFVVMPNHIHAIINVSPRLTHATPIEQRNPNSSMRVNPDMARHVPTLSKYIASFKSAVSKQARFLDHNFGWQSRYHDHLIRGIEDRKMIVNYIINNPMNWTKDCFAK